MPLMMMIILVYYEYWFNFHSIDLVFIFLFSSKNISNNIAKVITTIWQLGDITKKKSDRAEYTSSQTNTQVKNRVNQTYEEEEMKLNGKIVTQTVRHGLQANFPVFILLTMT